uniref:ATP synthase subunit a n=1 Tax=Petalocephala chlorophana TaxID=2501810 RepID=A0A7L8XEX9_9HEMI|nr:ATP synthase F0 subunit 6 [Petalocephala chlorophana]QOH91203.1 ATP synthase F0 subunit 6 [Petalocephala chlorophana]
MMNLFSVFDPCTGMFSLNWLSFIFFFFLVPLGYWSCKGSLVIFMNFLLMFLYNEISNLTKYLSSILFFLSLFVYLMILNLVGLVPYVFTCSSHLVFSLGLSLPFWFGLMFFGWLNNFNSMFIHLVPIGTPYLLMPFMVMIETISNFIRPFSLAVRLSANMIAGHLLMSLLGGSTCSDFFLVFIFFFIFITIFVFELAVSFIQSYVFVTLGVLYSSEV